jgi:hypothetical protein
MKIKTIDINAKEWFDKINGNSYFCGIITINYLLDNEETFLMPFQYGYGSQYEQEAKAILTQFNKISADYNDSLWRHCKKNNIKYNSSILENCKLSELKQIEKDYDNNLKTIKQ